MAPFPNPYYDPVVLWPVAMAISTPIFLLGSFSLIYVREYRVAQARLPRLTASLGFACILWFASVAAHNLVGEFPCAVHIWQLYILICFFMLVYIGKCYVLYLKTEYVHKCVESWRNQQEARDRVDSEDASVENSKVGFDDYENVMKTKRLISKKGFAIAFTSAVLIEAIPSFIGTIINGTKLSDPNVSGCDETISAFGTVAFGFINTVVLIWFSRKIRKALDSFGIRKELRRMSLVLFFCGGFYIVLLLTNNIGFPRLPLKTFDGLLAMLLSSFISSYTAVFESFAEAKVIEREASTAGSYDSSKKPQNSLLDFIKKHKNAYDAYLELLQSEYCTENLLFVMDCEDFFALVQVEAGMSEKQINSAQKLARQIHFNYLTEDSPMQVNISFASLQMASSLSTILEHSGAKLTELQIRRVEEVLMRCRMEILDVLHKDSWRRFKLSEKYRQILQEIESQENKEKLLDQVIQTST